jgi:hypothetical protein
VVLLNQNVKKLSTNASAIFVDLKKLAPTRSRMKSDAEFASIFTSEKSVGSKGF